MIVLAAKIKQDDGFDRPSPYSQLEDAFNRSLLKWFEARNVLGSEILRVVVEDQPDLLKAKAVLRVLRRITKHPQALRSYRGVGSDRACHRGDRLRRLESD